MDGESCTVKLAHACYDTSAGYADIRQLDRTQQDQIHSAHLGAIVALQSEHRTEQLESISDGAGTAWPAAAQRGRGEGRLMRHFHTRK